MSTPKGKPRYPKRKRAYYLTDTGVDFLYDKNLSGSITITLNDKRIDIPVKALVEFAENCLISGKNRT